MMKLRHLTASVLLSGFLVSGMVFLPAQAGHRGLRSEFNAHPVVRSSLLGAGLGAVVGGVTTHEGRRTRGAVKGALIGGGAGAAYGLLRGRGGGGYGHSSYGRGHGNRRGHH